MIAAGLIKKIGPVAVFTEQQGDETMKLEMRRVIIFTADIASMTRFYRGVLGLKQLADGEDWKEFSVGACNIALHHGKPALGKRPPKISFHAADVAAARASLMRRGAAMGKITSTKHFDFCDGKDPDGNPFQISSRRS
jgi:catechol 2,3-dioxygenase-like lactoylglutathione lyase family enzyme